MTIWEPSTGGTWQDYLFKTSTNDTDCSLTIHLPPETTVRTVLLSARDAVPNTGIGLTVSVGDMISDSLDL
jgi:hypothetical protein